MAYRHPHIERRSDPRFLARIAIYAGRDQEELLSGYTVNVGSGGLFIETNATLPIGTSLLLQFKLPGMDRIIACNSRVAWTNSLP